MATSSDSAGALRGLGGAAYFIAFLLVVVSVFDYVGAVWPFQAGDVSWRYGAVGLLSGFLLTPLLGVLVAMAMAALLGHAGALRALSFTSLAGAVLGLVLLVGFTLDTVQVRQGAAPDMKPITEMSAVKAGVKLLTGAIAIGWLGVAGLSRSRPGVARGAAHPAENRVVG